MACGENPKRVYGQKSGPSTRMGNVAGYRDAFQKAREYQRSWDKYRKDHAEVDRPRRTSRRPPPGTRKARPDKRRQEADEPQPPAQDFALETLVRRAARRDPRAQPLLPRRRDGDHARARRDLRLQDPQLPPRHRGLQDRRPPRRRRHRRVGVGRLVGLQGRGLRRHPRERGPAHAGRRPRDHPLRQRRSASSASIKRPPRRCTPAAASASTSPTTGPQVDHRQPGLGPRHRRDRPARSSPASSPTSSSGAAPLQRLHRRRAGVHRRRAQVYVRGKVEPHADFDLGYRPAGVP
jgi:hypothetical protein